MMTTTAQLAAIVAQFEAAQARLHRLLPTVPADRWSVRADPARWSVAECVAHLNLTGQVYLPLLRAAWAEARALGAPVPERYRRDLAGWLLSFAVGPMPRLGRWAFGRTRTIAAFVPSGDLPRERVVAEFDRLQAEQIALTRAADGLALDAVRITSPFKAKLKYNGYSCLVILPRHQHRHLWQAEQVWQDRP